MAINVTLAIIYVYKWDSVWRVLRLRIKSGGFKCDACECGKNPSSSAATMSFVGGVGELLRRRKKNGREKGRERVKKKKREKDRWVVGREEN